MRISNNMMQYNFLSSLNKSSGQQYKLQEQLSDGRLIHRPSDDPVRAVRSLRFNTSLSQNEQFTQNLKDAQSWMTSTDSAMSSLSSIMINIKEKVVQASNGTNPQDAVQAIGKEIDNLINQMIQIGNTQVGDRYIFSGQNDLVKPFTREGDDIIYYGDDQKVSMPIQMGAVSPEKDSVNLTGFEVFGDNLTIFNHLIEIKQHLESGTKADQEWLSNTGLQYIDDDHKSMLKSQTELGTRMNVYNMSLTMMENSNATITGDLSANEDIDIAKAIVDFKNYENVYKAALSVGSRIMPISLADFLQ
ncbi:hypothetical protein P22_0503 [Propionispora sp. 2/2-37]|uniref:flagellar hook-associated protein FlgL n=1 Tax=Propionispora sp. 2/2-37 TaxID=1677858 RepID=UPI0006BB6979|nr:flagellar hook-associated protein FlgL [Propionispora sp. 2/2-37]CUH94437.1 hypothetical protein P22_0503 [Propionispora sp. 2/2-37]